ncbi:MAG: PaaI family thioesterase [Sphingomonadaceae bacterium]|nr:PaaI family thioesterase [Sphingomonadaceae bacterium]
MTAASDADGWIPWLHKPDQRFHDLLGQMYFRVTDHGVESRMDTARCHSNALGFLHGGFLMSFVDMAMFAIIRPRFGKGEGAVTLSCATDFLTGGIVGQPIEAHGEVLKETGKMFFVRGLVTQNGGNVASFTGTMRKIVRRPPPDAPTGQSPPS